MSDAEQREAEAARRDAAARRAVDRRGGPPAPTTVALPTADYARLAWTSVAVLAGLAAVAGLLAGNFILAGGLALAAFGARAMQPAKAPPRQGRLDRALQEGLDALAGATLDAGERAELEATLRQAHEAVRSQVARRDDGRRLLASLGADDPARAALAAAVAAADGAEDGFEASCRSLRASLATARLAGASATEALHDAVDRVRAQAAADVELQRALAGRR